MNNPRTLCYWLLLLMGGLHGCSLTAREVEPELPSLPVNQANTVVYRLNGIPVVAHNYTDLATQLLLPLLGQFGGQRPVMAALSADGTLTIGCSDDQNVTRPGYAQHSLGLQLTQFRGAGAYAPAPLFTVFRKSVRNANDETWLHGPVQRLAATSPAEVVVTEWNPTTRHLRGSFAVDFEATTGASAASVRNGQFDLVVR